MTSTSIHSNAQVSRASFSQGGESSSKATTTTTTSKLRDSCHACALSKVKCHKQKPSCSRCTKRGIACEYIITKRPGRKRDSHSDIIDIVRRASSPATQHPWLSMTSSAIADSTLFGSSNLSSPPNISPTTPRSDGVLSIEQPNSDIFSCLLMPLEHYPPELMGMSKEFDEFFNSPVDFSDLGTLDHELPTQGPCDIAKLLMPPELLSGISSAELSSESKESSPPNRHSPSGSDTSVSCANDSYFCLIRALDIMKKISSNTTPASPQSSSGNPDTRMSNAGPGMTIEVESTQSIVSENKQTMEVLTTMLQCSCGDDGYLLMVLSMIVFRIVGRYAAAALSHPDKDGDRSVVSSVSASTKDHERRSGLGDEGPRRMAAQLILIELYRVQRLVNILSLKLQAHGRRQAANDEGITMVRNSGWESQFPTLLDHLTKAAPFSAARFAQLEDDMRRCLSTLSSEIINMLQQI